MLFRLKKKKPTLAELIPNNYIDIHSHVLPGIDDGAKTIEDTHYLLTEMQKIGFSKVITTPHTLHTVWDNTNETILIAKGIVENQLPELYKETSLQTASEYFMDYHFMQNIAKKEFLTLKDNYILVEMSYLNPSMQLFDILFELQIAGYQPILAHPERYNYYHQEKEIYKKIKDTGCLMQLNLLSSVGYYGKPIAKIADYLLENNMIDFVGSDIHHKNHIAAFGQEICIKNQEKLEQAIAKNDFFR